MLEASIHLPTHLAMTIQITHDVRLRGMMARWGSCEPMGTL